jgi:hypothetical protein
MVGKDAIPAGLLSDIIADDFLGGPTLTEVGFLAQ